MKQITIISKTTLIETFIYEIFCDEYKYKGISDINSPILSIIKERRPFLSKISVINENKEFMSIYKNYKTPLNNTLFTIKIKDNTYKLKESNTFKVPDFSINSEFGNLSVNGTIANGKYYISLNKNNIAEIFSKRNKDTKEYNINYNYISSDIENLIISIVIIIDNLYHYY